jgi:hypothetical protein
MLVTGLAPRGEEGGPLADEALDPCEQLELFQNRRQIPELRGRRTGSGEGAHAVGPRTPAKPHKHSERSTA